MEQAIAKTGATQPKIPSFQIDTSKPLSAIDQLQGAINGISSTNALSEINKLAIGYQSLGDGKSMSLSFNVSTAEGKAKVEELTAKFKEAGGAVTAFKQESDGVVSANFYQTTQSASAALETLKAKFNSLSDADKLKDSWTGGTGMQAQINDLQSQVDKAKELESQAQKSKEALTGTKAEGNIQVTAETAQATAAITDVQAKLAEIKDKTVTVTVKTVESHFGGGMVGIAKFFHGGLLKFAAGGKLPGFSSYDNIMGRITGTGQPVALAGGEMVVNNERTKMFDGLLNFINFGNKSAVSKFKASLSNFPGFFDGGFILPQVPVLSYNSGGNVPVGGAANFVQNIVNQSTQSSLQPVNITIGNSTARIHADSANLTLFTQALQQHIRGS